MSAREYLERPGLRRVLAAARERTEHFGEVRGTVRLDALNEAEAHELNGLPGAVGRIRARAGESRRIELRRLDAALSQTGFGLDLRAALELVGGPLDDRPGQRALAEAETSAYWAGVLAHPLCRDARVAAWAEVQRRSLGRVTDGRRVLDAALAVGALLPARPAVERTRLAAEALDGDPHALDDPQPLARMLLRQLAAREGTAPPDDAAGRRALWERFGVLTDPASCDVLTLGLRPEPDGPLARALALLHGQHFRITLGQLRREPLRFPAQQRVFLVENPTVLTAAEERLDAVPAMVCTSGWPNSAVGALLDRLRAVGAELLYHGDFDLEGVRIASFVMERFGARPWRFDAGAYAAATGAHPSRTRPLGGRSPASPDALAGALLACGREVHEEAVLDDLLADLAAAS